MLTLTQFALSVGVIGEGDRHGLKLKIGVIKWGTQQVVSHPTVTESKQQSFILFLYFFQNIFFPRHKH